MELNQNNIFSKSDKPKLVEKNSGLVVKNIRKIYNKKPVVRDLSVSLQRGEAVGLLGPNGAGKTTSFYMITGLVRPTAGRIFLDGKDITKLPIYQRASASAICHRKAQSFVD